VILPLWQAIGMGTDKPRVAVVIPSWNGAEDLGNCIDSLLLQNSVEVELLVVDNGSTDGSVEMLRQRGINHIPLPRNIGFAAAVNIGFRSTESEAVATVNSDTVLEPDALICMYRALRSDGRIGGAQPRILSLLRGGHQDPADPDALTYSLGQALTRDGRALEEGAGDRQGQTLPGPVEVFGVCGAACMFRREMVEALGGYDERYFAFYEDVDLNMRGRIMGWSFRVVPEAVVWHVGNAAWQAGFERPDAENARLVARNRLSTQVKFMPLHSLPLIALAEIGSLLRALRDRRFPATLAGKLSVLKLLPELLRERRRLEAAGDPDLARRWLGRSSL
jgi:GT2 family glycosyltransferase